jgi:hypothetical protein
LIRSYLPHDLIPPLRDETGPFRGRRQLFTRPGNLLALKTTLACSASAPATAPEAATFGKLLFYANRFQTGSFFRSATPTDVDYKQFMVEQLPSWEVTNERDLAYSLARAYALLKHYLTIPDAAIAHSARQLGFDVRGVNIDGVPLSEYIGIVLTLYSSLNVREVTELLEGRTSANIDLRHIIAQTQISRRSIDLFAGARSRTMAEFQAAMSSDPPSSPGHLLRLLQNEHFIADFGCFRRTPFLRRDANVLTAIDIRFVAEMLAVGVYWSLFFASTPAKRSIFATLWGRLFELYTADLFRAAYSESGSLVAPLSIELPFENGCIDALLDFGTEVIVFEFKASLLSHQAKADRNLAAFESEFYRKFVENERGERKGIAQLAAAALAIREGRVPTAVPRPLVYPVLVGYEASLESLFVNVYANELFQPAIHRATGVRPLTVLSIQELESLLPRITRGDFTWSAILEKRFRGEEVSPVSVSQTLYDFSIRTPHSRNEFLRKWYDAAFESIGFRTEDGH